MKSNDFFRVIPPRQDEKRRRRMSVSSPLQRPGRGEEATSGEKSGTRRVSLGIPTRDFSGTSWGLRCFALFVPHFPKGVEGAKRISAKGLNLALQGNCRHKIYIIATTSRVPSACMSSSPPRFVPLAVRICYLMRLPAAQNGLHGGGADGLTRRTDKPAVHIDERLCQRVSGIREVDLVPPSRNDMRSHSELDELLPLRPASPMCSAAPKLATRPSGCSNGTSQEPHTPPRCDREGRLWWSPPAPGCSA